MVCVKLFLPDAAIGFRHEDQLVPRNLVRLDSLGNYSFRVSVGVDVSRVPLERYVSTLFLEGLDFTNSIDATVKSRL